MSQEVQSSLLESRVICKAAIAEANGRNGSGAFTTPAPRSSNMTTTQDVEFLKKPYETKL